MRESTSKGPVRSIWSMPLEHEGPDLEMTDLAGVRFRDVGRSTAWINSILQVIDRAASYRSTVNWRMMPNSPLVFRQTNASHPAHA